MTTDTSTKEQEAAITAEAPRIIVKANPGSGKTRVLAARVNHLIALGIPEEQIAVFTYTNAAARELRARISHRLGHCGTLHSWVLERIPYGVATEEEIFDGYPFYAERLQDALGRPSNEVEGRSLRRSLERLRDWLRTEGLIDFQGALEFWLERQASMHLPPYRDILVDEAQDSSSTDWAIYQALAKRSGARLFAVGDVNQALYAWRGASPAIFERLSDPGWMGWTVLPLPYNFRSMPAILRAANRIMRPDPPNESTRNDPALPEEVQIAAEPDDWAETRTILDWIKRRPGTRAILARTNGHANYLKVAASAFGLSVSHPRHASSYAKALALVDLAACETLARTARAVDLGVDLPFDRDQIPIIVRALPYPDEADEVRELLAKEPTKNWSNAFREWLDGIHESTPAVYIGTVHSAKGREFNSVALVGLDNYRDTAEEWRIAYVGITRAKDGLLVTQANERNGKARDTHPIILKLRAQEEVS